METILNQIFDLLTTSPGNLVYHLVVGFAVISALQAVIITRQITQSLTTSRLLLGLVLIIISQASIFVINGLSWQGFAELRSILPPLDRLVTLLDLLLIIWLWSVPRPSRLWDSVTALFFIVICIGFLFTLANWSALSTENKFNATIYDQIWSLGAMALSTLGALILAIHRPVGWGIGAAILLVNLGGFAFHYFLPVMQSDLSGPVRLAQLCTFPLLPAVVQNLTPAAQKSAAPTKTSPPTKPAQPSTSQSGFKERRKHSAEPRTVHAWMKLAVLNDAEQSAVVLSRALAHTMLADLCYLVTCPTTTSNLEMHGGFDLIREGECPPMSIPRERVPTICNAVYRGKALQLGSETIPAPDLQAIAQAIGLEDCGHLLLVPLATSEKTWGAALFLTPYSNRVWTADDQSYFLTSVESMVSFLTNKNTMVGKSSPIHGGIGGNALQNELEILRQDNQLLLNELAELRLPSTADGDQPLKQAQEAISRLQFENNRLAATLNAQFPAAYAEKSQEVDQLEKELRQSLQEIASLQSHLAQANMQLLEMEKRVQQPIRTVSEDREVIASIIQELRQPLASLTGYADLLLSESAGILGALQLKFVERIRTSTEKMRLILDELIRLTSLSHLPMERVADPIPTAQVIDQVIGDTRMQLQEKNLTLQISLADDLPGLFVDRDNFYQILAQLLQNAAAASPSEGQISLRAVVDGQDSPSNHFLLQITDSGGGVDPQDLPRIFSRRYRAEHPLIQGIGDTGVGLSIVKTLVEAHSGRIWVDTDPGQTTTFSVLFPIRKVGMDAAEGTEESDA